MKDYTILTEKRPKWDEKKEAFFKNEVDKTVFKLEEVPINTSLKKYMYWIAESTKGEFLGCAWLYEKQEISVCVKANCHKSEVGTNLIKIIEQDAKKMKLSQLTAVVESKNVMAPSVLKWLYDLGYQWEIADGTYVSLDQALEALKKKIDSIYLSKKI